MNKLNKNIMVNNPSIINFNRFNNDKERNISLNK